MDAAANATRSSSHTEKEGTRSKSCFSTAAFSAAAFSAAAFSAVAFFAAFSAAAFAATSLCAAAAFSRRRTARKRSSSAASCSVAAFSTAAGYAAASSSAASSAAASSARKSTRPARRAPPSAGALRQRAWVASLDCAGAVGAAANAEVLPLPIVPAALGGGHAPLLPPKVLCRCSSAMYSATSLRSASSTCSTKEQRGSLSSYALYGDGAVNAAPSVATGANPEEVYRGLPRSCGGRGGSSPFSSSRPTCSSKKPSCSSGAAKPSSTTLTTARRANWAPLRNSGVAAGADGPAAARSLRQLGGGASGPETLRTANPLRAWPMDRSGRASAPRAWPNCLPGTSAPETLRLANTAPRGLYGRATASLTWPRCLPGASKPL